jgi:hypothetical protein
MHAYSETVDRLGWSRDEVVRHMDALPLLDEPAPGDAQAMAFHRLHWLSAAIALALLVAARLDLLPAMPW